MPAAPFAVARWRLQVCRKLARATDVEHADQGDAEDLLKTSAQHGVWSLPNTSLTPSICPQPFGKRHWWVARHQSSNKEYDRYNMRKHSVRFPSFNEVRLDDTFIFRTVAPREPLDYIEHRTNTQAKRRLRPYQCIAACFNVMLVPRCVDTFCQSDARRSRSHSLKSKVT